MFDLNLLQEYVVIVVLGICLCVGYVIKHSLDFIPNKYIPLIMGILGVVLNTWVNGFVFAPEVLLGGLISGLGSTGLYEAFKNLINKETTENNE